MQRALGGDAGWWVVALLGAQIRARRLPSYPSPRESPPSAFAEPVSQFQNHKNTDAGATSEQEDSLAVPAFWRRVNARDPVRFTQPEQTSAPV